MIRKHRNLTVVALALLSACTPPSAVYRSATAPETLPQLDTTDAALVEILSSALSGARETWWPGYRFDRMRLLAYRPGAWAILTNPEDVDARADGWMPYPPTWPPLSRPALFNPDGIESLIGQLAFDYQVAGVPAVAIPLLPEIPEELGERDRQLFAFVNHEAFHQYQRGSFGELNSPSEEAYPLLDAWNNAMAMLELRAIEDVLRAIVAGNQESVRRAAIRALVVHDARSELLGEDARTIERTKEIVEGTAKYVEARSVESFARWCEREPSPGRLCPKFSGESAASWLLAEVERRFAGDALAPRDMPRNRMYTVAATVGLLLDRFDPEWKTAIEDEGTRGSLYSRLDRALHHDQNPESLLAEVRRTHGWESVLASSRARVEEYHRHYEDALAEFENSEGRRLVIELPQAGFSRSRSSRGTGWTVAGGAQVLAHYSTYTLRRRDDSFLHLSIEDHSVLEELLAGDRRRLTLFVSGQLTATVDETTRVIGDGVRKTDFNRLELRGEGVQLVAETPGRLVVDEAIQIQLVE